MSSGSFAQARIEINFENQQLAKELYKQIILKIKKRKVYSSLKENILDADRADMHLRSKYDDGIRLLL